MKEFLKPVNICGSYYEQEFSVLFFFDSQLHSLWKRIWGLGLWLVALVWLVLRLVNSQELRVGVRVRLSVRVKRRSTYAALRVAVLRVCEQPIRVICRIGLSTSKR